MALPAGYSPGGERVATDSNFLGFEDIRKPEVDETLTERYGSELLTGMLDMAGAKKATGNQTFDHYEADRLMPKVAAKNAVGGAAGAKVTFTVDTASKLNVTLNQPPYPSTSAKVHNGLPVRKGDTIAIPGTKGYGDIVMVIVSAVDYTAGTFEAYPLDSTAIIPASPSTGANTRELIIYGNAMGEGSAQNDSMNSTVTKYSNNVQIIKDTFELTGTAASEKLWFKVNGKYYWTAKGERDTWYRFQNYKELTLLMGKKMAGTTAYDALVDSEGSIKTTEGLIPQVVSNGNSFTYASGAGWAMTDFENAVKVLDKQKGSRQNMMAVGIDLSLQIDKLIRTDFNNGALVFGDYKFAEKQALNLQFDSIKVGNYTFHKKTFDIFNDAQTLGVGNFPKEGLIIPMDMQVDAKSGERVQSMRLRYLAENGTVSRETKKAYVDYFKTTEAGKDKAAVRYLSEVGLECFALNRFGYITLA